MTEFAMRGIVEGFYGRPWTDEQRRRAISLLGPRGMNAYLVSTKDEPWQRADWRGPLRDEVLGRLADLAAHARAHGMTLGVSTSPGLTVCYSDPATIDDIVARYAQLAEQGITLFGLFLDDIPGELQHEADRAAFADLCAAHEHLVAAVAAAMPAGTQLVVCPAAYYGLGDEEYVARLGAATPGDVPLMWTGRQICSAYLHSADARALTISMGRPPLYWDNYPVNDVAMTHELHIGPYRGRDADLAAWCSGLLVNPMPLFEASLLPLLTVADYMSDAAGYDPDASWERALTDLFDDPLDRDAYRVFGRCHLDSCLSADAAPDLERELSRAMFEWRTGSAAAAVSRLRAEAQRLDIAVHHIASDPFENEALRREIMPWLAKLDLVARALSTLACHVAGEAGEAPLRSIADQLRALPARSAGDAVLMTLDEILALADAPHHQTQKEIAP